VRGTLNPFRSKNPTGRGKGGGERGEERRRQRVRSGRASETVYKKGGVVSGKGGPGKGEWRKIVADETQGLRGLRARRKTKGGKEMGSRKKKPVATKGKGGPVWAHKKGSEE